MPRKASNADLAQEASKDKTHIPNKKAPHLFGPCLLEPVGEAGVNCECKSSVVLESGTTGSGGLHASPHSRDYAFGGRWVM